MRISRTAMLLAVAALGWSSQIERRGEAAWPTTNHFRARHVATAPAGVPLAADLTLPGGFNPDSVRVVAEGASRALASKTEWRNPSARVSFISSGAPAYWIYFDEGSRGETERIAPPAMIGTGDRITYGRAGVRGRVAVGLHPRPAALDADGDGDLDLVMACPDRPYNGTYLFINLGTNREPLYDRAVWLGPGLRELTAADFNGDGQADLVTQGGYYSDFARHRLSRFVKVEVRPDYWIGRDEMWQPFDWDGDGRIDLLIGVSDWREYGWDDAFNEKGEWTRGRVHGYVYVHRNRGTNAQPEYEPPVLLEAGGRPLDLYGSPAPNPVDWLGRGVFDLIGGSFVDTVTLFRNTGTRTAPRLAAGDLVQAGGRTLRMDLCMIQPRVVSWHADGRPSLLIAEEDGTVALLENTAPRGTEPKLAAPRYLEQVDPYLKSGALSRPVAVDWDGDGKLDLIAGNSAGYLQFFKNTGTPENPVFEDRGYLKAGGEVIRRVAGPNGSVQGPAEEKWGYSNPSVADWDLDGKLDILVNDIWGAVVWHRNTGTRTVPALAPAQPIEVEWRGRPPKPDWVWWEPVGKQLVTQWRTTPKVVDWDRDGLPDLVMLNHQGYLSLYRRARVSGALRLLPPERIFVTPAGRFLNLAAGRAGASGRRKIEFADMDRDGDLDLITDSDEGPVWYENQGTQEKPVMQLRGTLVRARLAGHNPTPNVVDWNADGKLDLIIGAEDGFFYYFDGRYLETGRARGPGPDPGMQ
ncbi:MAG: VCBS repeat-containing protein [Acidobacteria bacterium]|nr:VCBS repeat-containing protein [Acidobacteriota bacterium]